MPPFAGGHCLQEKPVDHFPPLQGDPRSIVGPEEDEVGAAGWGSAPSPLCSATADQSPLFLSVFPPGL